jgi:nicotinamidase-related amidase
VGNEEKAWNYIIRVPEVEADLARSALIVIDLQKLFASRTHGTFKRLSEDGLAAEAEYAISRIEQLVVPNVARLAEAFRGAGASVVYARCASLRGDGSDQTSRHRAQGLVCPVWDEGAEILDEIAPNTGDVVITKSGSGCFTSTNLDHMLRNMGVSTVVLCGMWTNSCVETTARHAGDLDYDVVIVEDACVAMTPENHDWALRYLGNNFGVVRSTSEVVAAMTEVSRGKLTALSTA